MFQVVGRPLSSAIGPNSVHLGDSSELLKKINDCSVDLILSDIPYGIGAEDWDVLHNNTNSAYLGASPAQKNAGAVFKKRGKPLNGWSEADRAIPKEYYNWCSNWASDWYRVLKPGGSAIVFAGRRLSHRFVCAMEDAGFTLKDSIAWLRSRAPHRAQRISEVYKRRGDLSAEKSWEGWRVGNLRPTYEPVIWLTKPYKIGGTIANNVLENGLGAYNQEAFVRYMGSPDNIISAEFQPGESGLHPTQKPVLLMQVLIELTTKKGQIVLDPFAGSGSTLVAAKNLGRSYIGFEIDKNFYDVCNDRLNGRLL